jgi:hypothetical protein
MTTSTLQRFIYAKRPIEPGSYHVWTHDRGHYLGRVYRLDDVPNAPKWRAGREGPVVSTREGAAYVLLTEEG